MPETEIFRSSNDYWSKQTQPGDDQRARRYGWCAAGSALWCLSMLNDTAPAASRPDELRTGLLQAKYRWDDTNNDTLNLMGGIGLAGTQVLQDAPREEMLAYMKAHPGVYWFANAPHAMAVDTRPGRLLFYDIESGLYQYGSLDELTQGIRGRYDDPAWDLFSVTLA